MAARVNLKSLWLNNLFSLPCPEGHGNENGLTFFSFKLFILI